MLINDFGFIKGQLTAILLWLTRFETQFNSKYPTVTVHAADECHTAPLHFLNQVQQSKALVLIQGLHV